MKWILYGFRRIMRSLCLPLLYNLKYWVLRLFRPSGYYAYILMRIKRLSLLCYIFLLTFSPVFGIDHALAQDPTNTVAPADTPTPTNIPIFTDPTLKPTTNFTCNGQQPAGYMTVTPNPYWLMQCGMCITPAVTPTSYFGENPFDFTATPDPNITPTTTNVPTLTPTITPQPFNIEASFYDGGRNIPIEVEVSQTTTGFNGGKHWGIVIKNLSGLNGTVKVSGTIKVDVTYSFYPRLTQVKFGYIQHASVGTQLVTRCFMGCTSHDFSDNQSFTEELYFSNNSTPYSGYQTFLFEFDYYPKLNESITFDVYGYGSNTSSVTTDYLWTLQNINYFIGIPTPTPTIVPITDCSVISPATGSPDDLGDEFSLPDIGIGWGRCLTLGGWDINLEWAQQFIQSLPVSWTVPGMQICFKPITFGSLGLFGLNVDLDLIASVMAGVLIIRIIRQ